MLYIGRKGAWDIGLYAFLTLAYSIVFGTAVTYVLMAFATQHTNPSVVTASQSLQPMFTTFLGAIALKETIVARQIGGGFAILIGLLCICYAKYREDNKVKYLVEQSLSERVDNIPNENKEEQDEMVHLLKDF